MIRFVFFATTVLFFLSCNNAKDGNEFGIDSTTQQNNSGKLQRLMIYYPSDSLDKNGNKTYHEISNVELTAQNGKSFSTSSFRGKIVLSDFFFASCQGICPKMTSQLTRVQAAFPDNHDFEIVSYTVDPDRDSANSLQLYAEKFKADTSQWKFVTGPKKKLYDLARYDYFLPVQPGNGNSEDFIHSDQMVLLDRESRVRGYYNGTDSTAIDSLIVDIRTLLKEK
jgi:protein SCO1/2